MSEHNGTLPLYAFLEPIADVFANSAVKEVVIQRSGEIGIETHGWEWRTVPEFDLDRLDQIAILAANLAGEEFDQDNPLLRTDLPTGQRFTAIRPPATRTAPAIAIRVPSQRKRTFDDSDFRGMTAETNMPGRMARKDQVRSELVSLYRARDFGAFFRLAARSRLTILCCGYTGNGKTSFVHRLLECVPAEERIVTIQDAEEYGKSAHHNRVDLYFGSARVTALDCALISLRMRPDRVILQECSGPEGYGFFRVLQGGRGGSLTTLHCDMGHTYAFDALAAMVRSHPLGGQQANLETQLRRLVDIIVWCDRDLTDDTFDLPYVWFRDAEEGA